MPEYSVTNAVPKSHSVILHTTSRQPPRLLFKGIVYFYVVLAL